MKPLHEVLRGHRVICCVGSGGVGKTTTAAAVALRAAMDGQRALVLTIDPARRLANSLGLKELGNAETRIDPSLFAQAGLTPRGEMWAMMLDLKHTWDELVKAQARTPQQAEAILGNKLYQTLSTAMAGSLEYMAMEKVYEVYNSKRFDVVVLDTPPTSNALDFLQASSRILDVLDSNAMKIVLGPMLKAGKIGFKLLSVPTGLVLRTLARFTGADFLRDLSGFMLAFEGMYEGFKERAGKVKALLKSREAAFVLVTSANPLTIQEALFFHKALKDDGIATAAVVVNRVQRDPRRHGGPETLGTLQEALHLAQIKDAPGPALPERDGAVRPAERAAASLERAGASPDHAGASAEQPGSLLSERLCQTLTDQATLADLDRREIERLRSTLSGVPLYSVPRLRKDVHDLAGLWQIDGSLGHNGGE